MTSRARHFVWLAFLLLTTATAISQSLICRKECIDGLDGSCARAHTFLAPNTSTVANMTIYVERTARGIFAYSNFVTDGFDNPTKLVTKDTADLREIFINLVSPEMSPDSQSEALQTYHDNVRIYLDTSLFSDEGYPEVDVGDASYVAIVDGTKGTVLNGPVDKLDRDSPPPALMTLVSGCCLYGIPPHLAAKYQALLAAKPLDRSKVSFLSLVKDTGTDLAINASENVRGARIGDSGGAFSLAQIESAFRGSSGRTVVLLSHVEGQNFVIRDAAQNVLSSIPIASVRDLASKYNIELIDLGCETARHWHTPLRLGVLTTFNTADAVKALDKALSQGNNYADFFQSLTSENLRIVIDHGFVLGWPLCADVYSRANGRSVWIKLARIFVSFRKS